VSELVRIVGVDLHFLPVAVKYGQFWTLMEFGAIAYSIAYKAGLSIRRRAEPP
jgi:hypothetical protein